MDTARAMELMRESQSTVPTTPAPTTNRPAWVDETPVLGDIYRGLDWFRDVTAPIGRFAGQFAGGGGAGGVLGKGAQWLQRLLRGAVPAFASGGIVSGPTLAMVGEYAGAVNNPEVIAPLSDLQKMMGDSEQTAVLLQILRAIERGQHITVTVSEREIGRAAARYNNREMRQTGQSPYQW